MTAPTVPEHAAAPLAALWALGAEALPAQAAVKDADTGAYLWAAPMLSRWLAGRDDALAGATDAAWADAETAAALRAADQAALARTDPLASVHRVLLEGERAEIAVLRLASAAVPGQPRLLASLWIDQRPARQKEQQLHNAIAQIEQLQRANEALRAELDGQGQRDRAAGLSSRVHFEEQLRREVDLSVREHREFALVFIEIDPPVAREAELGAPAEAQVLDAMGRLLRARTRAMDACSLLEGRRFGVLLSGVGLATAHARMEGLRRQCATQVVALDGHDMGFTASMGVASFPHTAHSRDELVDASLAALAEAQRRGGNQVTLASIRFET